MPGSGISGSDARAALSLLRSLHSVLERLHLSTVPPTVQEGSLSWHHQCLGAVSLVSAIWTGVRWNLKAFFIWIFPTAKDVEHFQRHFLAIFIFFSWEFYVQIHSSFLMIKMNFCYISLVLTPVFWNLHIISLTLQMDLARGNPVTCWRSHSLSTMPPPDLILSLESHRPIITTIAVLVALDRENLEWPAACD